MAIDSLVLAEQIDEVRRVSVAPRPITFDEFVDLPGEDLRELVNGVLIEPMAANLEHEKLFGWLLSLLSIYVERKKLGLVLGSRTAVRVNEYGGRLPDILFVRADRSEIVTEQAIIGPPDLVIEIVSRGDRPSEVVALETEYRTLGVAEILFIDRRRGAVRLLTREAESYRSEELTEGIWASAAIEGVRLDVSWLLNDPRPDSYEVLQSLLTP